LLREVSVTNKFKKCELLAHSSQVLWWNSLSTCACFVLSGTYPSTCSAWEALPVATLLPT
jgi:hypothetical protein